MAHGQNANPPLHSVEIVKYSPDSFVITLVITVEKDPDREDVSAKVCGEVEARAAWVQRQADGRLRIKLEPRAGGTFPRVPPCQMGVPLAEEESRKVILAVGQHTVVFFLVTLGEE